MESLATINRELSDGSDENVDIDARFASDRARCCCSPDWFRCRVVHQSGKSVGELRHRQHRDVRNCLVWHGDPGRAFWSGVARSWCLHACWGLCLRAHLSQLENRAAYRGADECGVGDDFCGLIRHRFRSHRWRYCSAPSRSIPRWTHARCRSWIPGNHQSLPDTLRR